MNSSEISRCCNLSEKHVHGVMSSLGFIIWFPDDRSKRTSQIYRYTYDLNNRNRRVILVDNESTTIVRDLYQ